MKFSAIIPAYNEWPRIEKVLETACKSELLDEIIVIDDGSTDDTKQKIENFSHPKLQKIFLEKNGGKASAVMTGISASEWDFIVMIDSDLIGLDPTHIDNLIRPILEKNADVTLSIRENSLWIYKFFRTDFVSGERVVPKKIFENHEYFTDGGGFGLEVKMNEKILEENFRIKNITLSGVITPRKSDKMGFWKGTKADLKMIGEIISAVPLHRVLRQFFLFSRFSSRTK